MSEHDSSSIPRRDFVSQAALSALALGAAACAPGAAATTVAPTPAGAQQTQWDDTWFKRITARHRAVFEQPEIDYGSVTSYASRWLNGMRDAIGDTDAQAVLVIRHQAIPLVLNDAMWEKYGIGEERKLKNEGRLAETEPFAKLNPISVNRRPARAGAAAAPTNRAESNLAWFNANGHIILGCNVAFMGYAGILTTRSKGKSDEVLAELKANLIPGTILQPNGIYATLRAQEAGCQYIRCP